jgi:hypothetical protein
MIAKMKFILTAWDLRENLEELIGNEGVLKNRVVMRCV